MLDRGKVFLKKLTDARNKVAKITLPYFVDGTVSKKIYYVTLINIKIKKCIISNVFISIY